MAWRIEFSALGQKNIRQLNPQHRERVLKFLSERVAVLQDPRSLGEALKGSKLGHFWKYRVGDYRVIADIQDGVLCVLVVRISNRRDVYR
ncbi:type II toxin-antitoxin system RelE family toxin [Dyella sp. KRB-257]|uniref:type II toxin-antitoxin system RelE family toxin n=1 Tax=Dyella sp. KRB-257 TaxID=3400915 RepID=UPI003C041B33